jgi:hypothetical protein
MTPSALSGALDWIPARYVFGDGLACYAELGAFRGLVLELIPYVKGAGSSEFVGFQVWVDRRERVGCYPGPIEVARAEAEGLVARARAGLLVP